MSPKYIDDSSSEEEEEDVAVHRSPKPTTTHKKTKSKSQVIADSDEPPSPKKKKSKSKVVKKKVTEEDEEEFDDDGLMEPTSSHGTKKKTKKKKKAKSSSAHQGDDDDDYFTTDDDESKPKSSKKKKKKTKKAASTTTTTKGDVVVVHSHQFDDTTTNSSAMMDDIELGGGSNNYKKSKPEFTSHTSFLSSSDDPFAPRDGKTLLWREVNMTLKGSSPDEPDRKLLDNVWGEVPEKQTTAIMGPSGAGKTSLLNILAGRAASRGRVAIESDVRLNNFAVDPTNINVRKNIAFVAQDDSLQVTSTPREAIYFSAKLRLPRDTPERTLHKLVDKMLDELGLTHCADTYVGGALLKGISGGERKRTSVGVELVVKPAMVFLDEPTSGLDSFSAVQLCQVLKKVANAGASVLFTIHQPASEIFNSFDRLILMNKGRVMYQGSVQNVPRYFAERGHPCPPNYNPADWIMNVAQSVPLDKLGHDGFFPQDNRLLTEPFKTHIEGKDDLGITLTERHASNDFDDTPIGAAGQIRMLFQREIRNLVRDKAAIGARFGLTVFLSILIGVIFNDVGETDSTNASNMQSHFGALIMVLMMSMFGTAQPALLAFPEERPVFLREYSTNHYSVGAYFASRFTIEATITAMQVFVQLLLSYFLIGLQASFGKMFIITYVLAMASTAMAVMLGCAVEDPKLGQEMLPILFVPQMLFAGFFVVPELIPVWLRWASYLCSLTYSVRLALVAEFSDCGDGQAAINCANLLDNINADEDETWWYWLVLLVLFAAFRLFGLYILRRKATKFF